MNRPEIHQAGIRDVAFGVGVKIVEPCNLYGCKIGDGCFVGPFTEIQKGAVIGARTRVQSHALICELVIILILRNWREQQQCGDGHSRQDAHH